MLISVIKANRRKRKEKRRDAHIISNRNPLRFDPSRTRTLRRSLSEQLDKQFSALKASIRQLVIDQDAFGLREQVTVNELGSTYLEVPFQSVEGSYSLLVGNVFCATGEGGGVDPTCSPHSEVPAEPGTVPVPPGHIRAYHYTHADPEEIKKEGLLLSKAKGHTYGEPDLVWGSTLPPGSQHTYVEFHVPASDLSHMVEYPGKGGSDADLREWMKGNHHIGLTRDVEPKEFVAIHEPWHGRYRYIKDNPQVLKETLAGENDFLLKDREYGPAIRQIKKDYGGVANVFCPTGVGGGVDPSCSPGGAVEAMPKFLQPGWFKGEVGKAEKAEGEVSAEAHKEVKEAENAMHLAAKSLEATSEIQDVIDAATETLHEEFAVPVRVISDFTARSIPKIREFTEKFHEFIEHRYGQVVANRIMAFGYAGAITTDNVIPQLKLLPLSEYFHAVPAIGFAEFCLRSASCGPLEKVMVKLNELKEKIPFHKQIGGVVSKVLGGYHHAKVVGGELTRKAIGTVVGTAAKGAVKVAKVAAPQYGRVPGLALHANEDEIVRREGTNFAEQLRHLYMEIQREHGQDLIDAAKKISGLMRPTHNYDPSQERDEHGRWVGGALASAAHFPAHVMKAIRDKAVQKYRKLESRYGPKMAKAIIGTAILGTAIPVPGATAVVTAPVVALAEMYRYAHGVRNLAVEPISVGSVTDRSVTNRDTNRDIHGARTLSLAGQTLPLASPTAESAFPTDGSVHGARIKFESDRLKSELDKELGHLVANLWKFRTTPQKVEAFRRWIETQINTVGLSRKELWEKFIEQGWRKGQGRAFDDVRAKAGASLLRHPAWYEGSREEFLRSSFARPVSVEKVKLLAGRAFNDLNGITKDMSTRMSRYLVQAFTRQEGAAKVARGLAKEVDMARSRALRIARTEIVRSHAVGNIHAMRDLGVKRLGVQVEWTTARDDSVCPACEDMEGETYDVDDPATEEMIPLHPNCRCAWVPAGDVLENQFRNFSKPIFPVLNRQPVVAIDFDGTIVTKRVEPLSESEVRPGVKAALRQMHEAGIYIAIWSANKNFGEIPLFLISQGVDFDSVNQVPPENETGSRKIDADLYIDDRAVPADGRAWSDIARESIIRLQGKARQPIGISDGYDELREKADKAQDELADLLAPLDLPTVQYDKLDMGELEHLLQKPGGLIVCAPIKSRERATQKVEDDYGGDWSKLLDMVRCSVAFDAMPDLEAAVDVLRRDGAVFARFPKDRFRSPLGTGYRDYLVNFRLPSGMIAEVQFHLKPFLIARERQHLLYGVIRQMESALEAEGREEFTPAESAVAQEVKDQGKMLFAKAQEQVEAEAQATEALNTFCPTGPGGGIDPTCGADGQHGRVIDLMTKAQYGKFTPEEKKRYNWLANQLQRKLSKDKPEDQPLRQQYQQEIKDIISRANQRAAGTEKPAPPVPVTPKPPEPTPAPPPTVALKPAEPPKVEIAKPGTFPLTPSEPTVTFGPEVVKQWEAKRESLIKDANNSLAVALADNRITKAQFTKYQASIENVLRRMPAPVIGEMHLNQFRWYRSMTAVQRSVSAGRGTVAYYEHYSKSLNCDDHLPAKKWSPGKEGLQVREHVYAHELLHSIDPYLGVVGYSDKKYSSQAEWQLAWNEEIQRPVHDMVQRMGRQFAPWSPLHGVGQYGASKKSEGFAEFGRLLYADEVSPECRKEIETKYPKCLAFFRKNQLLPKGWA